MLVGDKVPIVTTTQGSTGFVSESVSYVDVGLKLDVEPTVYVDDDVGIKVALEVSTLGTQTKTASGTIAYQIGTRNASTVLRLHDGETQLLAGLISTQDISGSTKVPVLGDIPLAERLLSNQTDKGQRDELVLSITPHIIRSVRRPDASEAELWIGTESLPRLRPAGGMITTADTGPSSTSQPGAPGSTGTVPAGPAPQGPVGAEIAPTPTGPVARWIGPGQVKAGDTFVVALELQADQAFRGLPIQLSYSKDFLELLEVQEGDFFKQGDAQTSFTKTIDAPNGRASAGVLRSTATGASGKGTVFTLRFKARAAGAAELNLLGLQPVGLVGPVPPAALLPVLRVQVQ